MILGLTGSYGSGKSRVASFFHQMGLPVQDADQVARDVVEPGTPALAEIVAAFGPEVLTAEGRLDRPKVAGIVFNDAQARRRLNNITHPRVAEAQARFVQEHRRAPAVILEVPLLLEAGARRMVDRVIVVTVDEKTRFGRLRRAGHTEKEIIARLGSQMPQARKIALADDVIDNRGDPASTQAQVEALARRLGLLQPTETGEPARLPAHP